MYKKIDFSNKQSSLRSEEFNEETDETKKETLIIKKRLDELNNKKIDFKNQQSSLKLEEINDEIEILNNKLADL